MYMYATTLYPVTHENKHKHIKIETLPYLYGPLLDDVASIGQRAP